MGIPSYYKKLIGTVPGLVSKGYPAEPISWLFMDFNCLIYHCLHREDTPVYPGDADRDVWELAFLDCVVQYCLKVIQEVKPAKGVYIAVDGVVPMAKMRQQRLRRFKSIWLSQHEEAETEQSKGAVWDRNAITPGTLFMGKLRNKITDMIAKHGKKTWKLSSSDEPGEGEHKIIREWRTEKYKGNVAVYGLDADLIVLSMLGRETAGLLGKVWLFREEVNAGKMVYDASGEEVFEWFSVSALTTWLCGNEEACDLRSFVLDYCFAMSVLGNDFLPSSLGLKIREDGHNELLEILRRLHSQRVSLIDSASLAIRTEGLLELFCLLAQDEEARITKYVSRKQYQARNLERSGETVMVGDNDWPMYHMEENVLLESSKQLVEGWRHVYLRQFFPGFHSSEIPVIAKEYLYGIQWIWAYYTGRHDDVCYDWCYTFSLPPLWSWVCAYLQQEEGMPAFPGEGRVLIRAEDIQPTEQLALVLPLESWSLLPPCPQRALPYLAPHLFPASFSFDSVGKRFFWECESLIPLPSIRVIKDIVSRRIP